jgi:hypothetical protein
MLTMYSPDMGRGFQIKVLVNAAELANLKKAAGYESLSSYCRRMLLGETLAVEKVEHSAVIREAAVDRKSRPAGARETNPERTRENLPPETKVRRCKKHGRKYGYCSFCTSEEDYD